MAKKLTREEFCEKLAQIRPGFLLIGEYKGVDNKTLFRNPQGVEWEVSPYSVLSQNASGPLNVWTLERLNAELAPRGITVSNFVGMRKRADCVCRMGHRFSTNPATMIHNGTGCPECKRLNASNSEQDRAEQESRMNEFLKSHGGSIRGYTSSKAHVTYTCSNGHQQSVHFESVRRAISEKRAVICPTCLEEHNADPIVQKEKLRKFKERRKREGARYWEKHGEKILVKDKERYATDPDYRQRVLERNREYLAANNEHINTLRRDRHSANPMRAMIQSARRRAVVQGLPFDDAFMESMTIPDMCPLLETPLIVRSGAKGAHIASPTFDKLVPYLGYVAGNVRIISHLANRMKNAASVEQLLVFKESIIPYVSGWSDPQAAYYNPDFKHHSGRNWLKLLLKTARKRAKEESIPFDIDDGDIAIPVKCPLTGIDIFSVRRGENQLSSATIDRIDPSLGYTKGNVRAISYLGNSMKNSASIETLRTFAKNIAQYLDGTPSRYCLSRTRSSD